MNPSTADATVDDPTVSKCIKLARFWEYGGIVLVNLFAWRATNKSVLRTVADPIGPRNDQEIMKALVGVEDVLLAWGNDGVFRDRSATVRALLKQFSKNYLCIKQNRSGEPVQRAAIKKVIGKTTQVVDRLLDHAEAKIEEVDPDDVVKKLIASFGNSSASSDSTPED